MIRLTAIRLTVVGAAFAAAVGGAVAATAASHASVPATLTSASPTPTPSPSPSTSGKQAGPDTAAPERHRLALRLRRALVEATSKATGQTVAQVRAQLRAGRSLDEIAGGKAADVKAAVLQDVRSLVEKAVDAKRITQAQADKIIDRAPTAIDRIMAAHHTPKAAPSASPAA